MVVPGSEATENAPSVPCVRRTSPETARYVCFDVKGFKVACDTRLLLYVKTFAHLGPIT